jgi:hypothetical protein
MQSVIVAKRRVTLCALLLGVVLAGCTGPSEEERAAEMARMKDQIRRELLDELQANPPTRDADGNVAAGVPLPAPAAAPVSHLDPATLGSLTGRILVQGQGLAGCHVKMVRLVEARGIFEAYKTFQEGMEFEAVTGADGVYRLDSLPEGSYAARWLPKGESGWIRRLCDKPDAVVKAGDVTTLADLDLQRITIIPR